MVYEIAEIDIIPCEEANFESAVTAAAPLFRAAKGCLSLKLWRSIEFPSRYRLMVGWENIEAHTVQFKNSESFQSWRKLASPYFAAPPRVEHVSAVLEGF